MFAYRKWLARTVLLCACGAFLRAQVWSEKDVVERFESLSPQARELRARVAVVEADARARAVYPNPSVSYSREGAGYAAFFEGSQTLPVSGRMRYLREAGGALVAAADTEREGILWSLKSDLRIAFYRLVAAQERARLISAGIAEVERLDGILRKREEEGEGSRYDRLRAERERTELRTDLATARALAAAAGARLAGFLPEGSTVQGAQGTLDVPDLRLDAEELTRRALGARAEYGAAQKSLTRFQLEEQAARRLRIPEPTIAAGFKRGNVVSGVPPTPFGDETRTALAFSVSVPLQVFNKGQYEVARYQAEQARTQAEIAAVARRIRTEVLGANEVMVVRRDALAAYQTEVDSAGHELESIAQISYQEGEIGILELLDSLRVNRLANLRMLDLRAGVKEAWIELERAVGEEVHP